MSHFCSSHLYVSPSPTRNPSRSTVVQDRGPAEIDLSAELGITSGDFKDNEEIYFFLCKLTYLLSANRRRAAVLAYITSQALRTSCAIQKQFDADRKEQPTEIIMDIAHPRRPHVDDPSNLYKFVSPAESPTEPS